VKSSARALGRRLRLGVAIFYALALACLATALWRLRPDPLVLLLLAPAALHLGRQAWRAHAPDPAQALALFRSNTRAGALMFAAVLVAAL
jgi:4-hydroxybenzoate polyprenyltransferase